MSIVDVEDNKEQIEKELKEKEKKESEKKLDATKRPGLLEMAMKSVESKVETKSQETLSQDEFEDLVTLSNSFKELGVKEFEAQSIRDDKGLQLSKQMNDIAKVMAKKIAKYVGAICMQEAKSAIKLSESQEEILKLNQKIRLLEEQIKKIRLLLAESNRNLNSYRPFAFGLYKKLKTKKH